ncbi:MAG: hypothetical protein AAF901_03165 [Bacteroidota bacterium]
MNVLNKSITLLFTLLITIALTSCVQERHPKTVTFKVDMNGIDNVYDVGIRGNFTPNRWNDTVPLTDDNNDGIYEGTVRDTTAINQIQFKFVYQGNQFELGGADNRTLEFEYQPETIIYKAVFDNPDATITRQ